MNRNSFFYLTSLLFVLMISLSSCEAIMGIFKAGVWTGVIVIALLVFVVLYFIGRSRK